MKFSFRILVLTLSLLFAGQHVCAEELKRLPPAAFTLGMMTTFIYRAEAYRTLCGKHVSAKDLNSSVGDWLERNKPLIDQIIEAGRKMKWAGVDSSSEKWLQMQERDAARLRAQIAEIIEPEPKLMCMDGIRMFRDGSVELIYFPYHLKALGISIPAGN